MLTKKVLMTLFCIALGGFAPVVNAEQLIGTYSGDRSGNTAEFQVEPPWIMDWLVSGDQAQYEAVGFALINAVSGAYEGAALKTKSAGNGVRLFEKGGRFYFRVDASMMNWKIKVIHLTEQEAEQYKPKPDRQLYDQ